VCYRICGEGGCPKSRSKGAQVPPIKNVPLSPPIQQKVYPEVREESKQEVDEDPESNSNSNPIREEFPFQLKLRQLEEMGFSSRSRNIEVLIRNGGDVLRAVKDLLDKHN